MLRQITRFSSIGVLSTVLHVCVALLAESVLGFSGISANTAGFIAALLFSYVGHSNFTFNVPISHGFHLPRFIATALIGFGLSTAIVWLAHERAGSPFWLAMALVAISVPAMTFLMLKLWVFRDTSGVAVNRLPLALLIALGTAALHFFLVAMWYHLPLIDLPNHIARFYIATDPHPVLQEFYRYEFAFKANSAVDVLWLTIGQYMVDPVRFASLTMAFYAFNLIMSVSILSRVIHGEWLVWPVAVATVVFNANFFFGFQNYLFTVPFAFYGLALWLALEKVTRARRALLFILPAFIIYQMHLIAFSILPIVILGMELSRIWRAKGQRLAVFKENAVSALPFILPIAHFLLSRLLGPPSPYGDQTNMGALRFRFEAFLSPTGVSSAEAALPLQIVSFLLLLLLLLVMASALARKGPRLTLAKNMGGALIVLLLASALTPVEVGGVEHGHLRYPFVLIALFLAATKWVDLRRRQIVLLVMLVGGVFVWRMGLTVDYFRRHNNDMADLTIVLEALEAGDRVLPLRVGEAEINRRSNHLQAYAVVHAQAFVPTLFQGTHGLTVTEKWKDNATPAWSALSADFVFRHDYDYPARFSPRQIAYWNNWQDRFTHVLSMGSLPPETVSEYGLVCQISVGRFSLFRVKQALSEKSEMASHRDDECL